MKKTIKSTLIIALSLTFFSLAGCKKCHGCHYDKDGQEVELGEYCDKNEINDLETNGYTVDSVTYEVHCHEH